jgi:hypothetical protein
LIVRNTLRQISSWASAGSPQAFHPEWQTTVKSLIERLCDDVLLCEHALFQSLT